MVVEWGQAWWLEMMDNMEDGIGPFFESLKVNVLFRPWGSWAFGRSPYMSAGHQLEDLRITAQDAA